MTDGMRRLWTVAATLLLAAPAWSGPLVITPTTVTIAPDRHSAVIEVENKGDDPVDLQFRAYDWQQENGEDRLAPTDSLVVSPAIATLAPHGKQVFRVLQLSDQPPTAAAGRERSYRLRLNQLPRSDQAAVAILLEFSLPVFQSPVGAAPRLTWSPAPGGITVTNNGTRRVRLRELAVQGPGGAPAVLTGGGSPYLLSGASRTYAVASSAAGRVATRLVGAGDTGPIDVPATALAAR